MATRGDLKAHASEEQDAPESNNVPRCLVHPVSELVRTIAMHACTHGKAQETGGNSILVGYNVMLPSGMFM